MEWDDSYRIGHPVIDNDHRHLFGLMRELNDAIHTNRADALVQDILNEIVDYTKYHFTHEETEMAKHGYPDFLAHRRAHESLIFQVNDLKDHIGDHGDPVMQLARFLGRWLKEHVLGDDRQFGEYLATLRQTDSRP